MPWSNDVPFTGPTTSCRGCGARIGWIERSGAKPVPVEIMGWRGIPTTERPKGAYKQGFTPAGESIRVVSPAGHLLGTLGETEIVFESHFAFCPRAGSFGTKRRR